MDCIFCKSNIKVSPEERDSFEVHMVGEHLAKKNLTFLLVVCLLDEEERGAITEVISNKYQLDGLAAVGLSDSYGGPEDVVQGDALEDLQHIKVERKDETESPLQEHKINLKETKVPPEELQRNHKTESAPSFMLGNEIGESLSDVPHYMELDEKQVLGVKSNEVVEAFIGGQSPSREDITAEESYKIVNNVENETSREQLSENSFAEDLERWRKLVSEIEKGPRLVVNSSESEPRLDLDELLNNQRFKCDVCPVVCKFRASLRKHKKKNHMNTVDNELRDPSYELSVECDEDQSNSEPQDTVSSSTPQKEEIEKEAQEKILQKGKLYELEIREELEKNGKLTCNICDFVSRRRHNFSMHMRRIHGIRQRARRKDAWKPEFKPSLITKEVLKKNTRPMNKVALETNLRQREMKVVNLEESAENTKDLKQDKTLSLRKGLESVTINKSWSNFLLGSIHSEKPKNDTLKTSQGERQVKRSNPYLIKDHNKSSAAEDPNLPSLKTDKGRCPKCGEVKVNLRGHYLSVHIEGSFPCKDCDKICTSSHKLSDHRHKKHPKNPKKEHRYSAM